MREGRDKTRFLGESEYILLRDEKTTSEKDDERLFFFAENDVRARGEPREKAARPSTE